MSRSPTSSLASFNLSRVLDDLELPSLLSESLTSAASFSTFSFSLLSDSEEPLSTRGWTDNLVFTSIPSRTPWIAVEETDPVQSALRKLESPRSPCVSNVALPKASIPVPSMTLTAKHRRNVSLPSDGTDLSPHLRRRASLHPHALHRKSFRSAKVLNTELLMLEDGKTKRVSVEIPPSDINPEVIDIALGLQSLNAFFKEGLHDLQSNVSLLDQEKQKLTAPALTISDSKSTMSVDAADASQPVSSSSTLAVRRGKSNLPTLTFRPMPEDTSYPGIPSAFLGSPKNYSPLLKQTPAILPQSLPLTQMISNLRAQCAALAPRTPSDIVKFETDNDMPAMDSPDSLKIEDDEWAFAHELMAELQRSRESANTKTEIHDEPLPPPARGILSDSPLSLSSPSPPPLGLPPSGPLPSCPSPQSGHSSPAGSIRGILKNRKSVRFAYLPVRRETTPAKIQTIPSMPSPPLRQPPAPPKSLIKRRPRLTPRHSTGSPSVPRKPSPLSGVQEVGADRVPVHQPIPSATRPIPPSRAASPSKVPRSKLRSSQPRATALSQMTKSVDHIPPSANTISQADKLQRPRPGGRPAAVGVASGRAMARQTEHPEDKENIGARRPPLILPTSDAANEGDRNAKRRAPELGAQSAKGVAPAKASGQKGRMPAPFRNILTRFK